MPPPILQKSINKTSETYLSLLQQEAMKKNREEKDENKEEGAETINKIKKMFK